MVNVIRRNLFIYLFIFVVVSMTDQWRLPWPTVSQLCYRYDTFHSNLMEPSRTSVVHSPVIWGQRSRARVMNVYFGDWLWPSVFGLRSGSHWPLVGGRRNNKGRCEQNSFKQLNCWEWIKSVFHQSVQSGASIIVLVSMIWQPLHSVGSQSRRTQETSRWVVNMIIHAFCVWSVCFWKVIFFLFEPFFSNNNNYK